LILFFKSVTYSSFLQQSGHERIADCCLLPSDKSTLL
jgi:hypothetical protein